MIQAARRIREATVLLEPTFTGESDAEREAIEEFADLFLVVFVKD